MDPDRFLGKLGVAAVAFRSDALKRIQGATRSMPHLSPNELAQGEDFWFQVRNAFTIDPNQINLNSGRVSPAPRVAQEAMEIVQSGMELEPGDEVDAFAEAIADVVRNGGV